MIGNHDYGHNSYMIGNPLMIIIPRNVVFKCNNIMGYNRWITIEMDMVIMVIDGSL